MKTYQRQPNAIHFTDEELTCAICLKKTDKVIQIGKRGSLACFGIKGCFTKLIEEQFRKQEILLVRLIVDVNYDQRKTTKKKERAIMSLKVRFNILTRDKFKCVLCGQNASDTTLEIDHIIPISKGGKSVSNNLRSLCFACNRGKGGDCERN